MKTTEEFLIQSVEGETPELFKKLGVPYWRYEAEVNMKTEDGFDKEVIVRILVPKEHHTLILCLKDLGWVCEHQLVNRYDEHVKYKKHMISDIDGVFHPVEEKPEPEKKTPEEIMDEITETLLKIADTEYVGTTPATEKEILDFHKNSYTEQAEYIISVLCDGDNKAGRELLPEYPIEEIENVFADIEWLRTPYGTRYNPAAELISTAHPAKRIVLEINIDF